MVCAVGAYAVNVGDYIYTTSAKFKVTGENLVTNGTFTQGTGGLQGWLNENGVDLSSDIWEVVTPEVMPEGVTGHALSSKTATGEAGSAVTGAWQFEKGGVYTYSYYIKGTDAGSTSITTGGANYLVFFTNADGTVSGKQVAEAATFSTDWVLVTDTVIVNDGEFLVFEASQLAQGMQLTGFEIHAVSQVYDTRIADRQIAWAEKLIADPNFNIDAAADARAEVEALIEAIRAEIAEGNFDNEEYAKGMLEGLQENLTAFMNVSSKDLATEDNFKYITDLTAFPKYNRGNIKNEQVIGGFKFRGDNWLHGSGSEYLNKQIQNGYKNGPGSVSLYNKLMPAGKYYIAAEMRNSVLKIISKVYTYFYDLEAEVKAYVGTDSASCGMIKGEDFTKFYFIGELKEGEEFDAGFWWDGPLDGNSFNIKSFEIRSFGDPEEAMKHAQAWDTFIAQWNAAVGARNKTLELMADKANYPWQQDSLAHALAQWDPLYNDIVNKGWVTAEGKDAGVATTDELNEWAEHQGYYPAAPAEGEDASEDYTRYGKYAVVRGYQYANNYVIATNKPIADLAADIEKAKNVRDDDMYVGDAAALQAAIDAAQAVLDDVKANTTDEKMDADLARIEETRGTLAQAVEEFKTHVLTPIANIDFSNKFQLVEDTETGNYYKIDGVTGTITFLESGVRPSADVELNGVQYELGFTTTSGDGLVTETKLEDVLRVGSTNATVTLTEGQIPTDADVIRATFDLYVGNLITKYVKVELQNAAGERVAGFSFDRYDGTTEYNDFNNADNTGLDLAKYVTGVGSSSASNDAICVESNKSSFDLIVDYKAQTLQGIIDNAKNGVCTGELVALPALEDNKIVKFVLTSNYNNDARRCWFDNLKMYKYASKAEGPVQAIETVAAANAADKGIYTLTGLKVNADMKTLKSGLYIVNGKKYLVK